MKPLSRILVLVASLLMIGGFFFPVWSIELQAPQYPEGLGMKIWIDKLSGDIQIINGLNHYIGMKEIDASMFPEFTYMKYILGALIGLGMLTALFGKKPVLYTWFGLLVIAAAAGMYDFWAWEYDYGHNLDPRAAIIVPGMSYQPPLLGYKDLLNFRAGSFPDLGGYAIIIGGIISAIVVIFEMMRKTKTEKAVIKINVPEISFGRKTSVGLSSIALLFVIGFLML